jgi:hypothetical protein
MWLWDYAFVINDRRVYTRSQFRTWEKARDSALEQYPRVMADLSMGVHPPFVWRRASPPQENGTMQ